MHNNYDSDQESAERFAQLLAITTDTLAEAFAEHLTTVEWTSELMGRLHQLFRNGLTAMVAAIADGIVLGSAAGRAQAIRTIENMAHDDDE